MTSTRPYRVPATDHGWAYDVATGSTCCESPAAAHETTATELAAAVRAIHRTALDNLAAAQPADGPDGGFMCALPARPGSDPVGAAAHAVRDALDLAHVAATRDPDSPVPVEAVGDPIQTDVATWGLLAVHGTTPVRITVELARPEEAESLGCDLAALGFPPAPADPGPPAGRNHRDYAAGGELACTECGEDMFLDGAGVAHHAGDGPTGIDHDADAAHVALAPDGDR